MKSFLPITLLAVLSACTSPKGPTPSIDFTGLSEGWNTIVPGGETACATGEDFAFNFRPGGVEHLTVILPGGGACSSYEACDLREGTFLPGMMRGNLVDDLQEGLFDFSNPRNPITDHSILFVPYCTGDVFLGDEVVTYENESGDSRTTPHVGFLNTMSALEWLFSRASNPSSIAVLGSSAGAIATPLFAGVLAEHFPDAQIYQLGDGAGSYQGPGVQQALRTWQGDALFEGVNWLQPFLTDSTEFITLYDAVSLSFDHVQLHQYNTESDSVQVSFVRAGTGAEPDLPILIRQNLNRIASVNPNFRSYTMTGSLHVILDRNELYQDSRYPTPLLDWISAVLRGESVESIWVGAE